LRYTCSIWIIFDCGCVHLLGVPNYCWPMYTAVSYIRQRDMLAAFDWSDLRLVPAGNG